ncbi:hypothetical protein [Halomontanus rarus]|uniref:hypothetical protein n=1 Tax=Halomontanus rarus TaxID=3034020 RepID=UPI001A99D310
MNRSQTIVDPGTNQTLATVEITADGNETVIEDTTHNFPFPAWLVNTTRTVSSTVDGNQTQYTTTITGDLVIQPPSDADPGDRSNTFYVILPAESIDLSFDYTVREVRNWTVTPQNVSRNISVGSSGVFSEFLVEQHGNADQTITTNVTGDLGEYLNIEPSFSVHPNTPHTGRLSYQVREDVPFGNYSGQLELASENETKTVNLTAVFQDEIVPTVKQLDVPETVMATTVPEWEALVTDNLAVDNVVANITKEVTVTDGNTTSIENRSVEAVEFTHVQNTDRWTAEFAETADMTQYYANITVTDTAGNSVTRMAPFTVEGLDAVQVENENFVFSSIRHQEQTTELILDNRVESPFTLQLDRFEYAGNTSVQVGVLAPSESSPEYFDEPGTELSFSKPGDYRLVIDSRSKESISDIYRYDGRLTIDVPEQHVNVSNIVFSGQINSADYPKPREMVIKEFRGVIGYGNVVQEFEDQFGDIGTEGSREYAYYIGRLPAENCRGNGDWSGCTSLAMGEVDRIIEENDELHRKAVFWKYVGGLGGLTAVVFMLVLWRKQQLHGRMFVRARLPKSEVFDR